MDAVLQKLDEAKRLYQDARRNFDADQPDFIHYVNASLNSARSVTLVMQKVGKNYDKQKFVAWYEQEKSRIFCEEDDDFILLRNITDHQKPINPNQRIYSGTIGEPNKKFENIRLRINLVNLTAEAISITDGKKIPVPASAIDKDFVVEEFDSKTQKIVRKEHFIKSLGKYLDKLEIIVQDFEKFVSGIRE